MLLIAGKAALTGTASAKDVAGITEAVAGAVKDTGKETVENVELTPEARKFAEQLLYGDYEAPKKSK